MAGRSEPPVVRASGVVPWRLRRGVLQVAMVHRPRYDDWSWPKGKLDRGEDCAAAAAREGAEETGLTLRLGLPLPRAEYPVTGPGGRPAVKHVRYWAATPVGGAGVLEHEVDEVTWLPPAKARRALTYPRDQIQLDALVAAYDLGHLDVWTLVVVRHAKAVPRSSWTRSDDMMRPLDPIGERRADRLAPVLAAYAPVRLVTSPAVRCRDTVMPFARSVGLALDTKTGLSEEGYSLRPDRAHRYVARLFELAEPVVVCTHGKVLPDLLAGLALRGESTRLCAALRRLAGSNLDKGEALALTVAGTGRSAAIVALERHRPPRR